MTEKKFNPLDYPVCLDFPNWLETSAWTEHIPFGMYVMAAVRPHTFVELGTFYGVSYFAFCQAVKTLNLNTKCYAIDTWEGDEHAGEIEKGILRKIEGHNLAHYADFSRLVQSTFDDAQNNFAGNSIDLLHIDGLHRYKMVKHDFEIWLPKMSDRGIILFHDINVREKDFGVWKLWDEVKEKYPSFSFLHGHGLGIIAVGKKIPEELEYLFSLTEKDIFSIRNFFYQYGARIDAIKEFNSQKKYIEHLRTHEQVVQNSYILRLYRILRFEGIESLLKKIKTNKSPS